ncbi:MAG: hypothetical protein LBR73_08365 [Oscillospiraceae bacterium]|jgi:hypothetical protein|nr:hypothetical protein [Oscillospiraceae bacterium]
MPTLQEVFREAPAADVYSQAIAEAASHIAIGGWSPPLAADISAAYGLTELKTTAYYKKPSDRRYGLNNEACFFAEAALPDGTPLVVVSVRGTFGKFTDSDWISNATLHTRRTGVDGVREHFGFSRAADKVYKRLLEYCGGVLQGKAFLLTGHSRGAAVAGILAVRLLESGDVNPAKLYTYTFAAPDCITYPAHAVPAYPAVFNFCNQDDLVPHIPGQYFEKAAKVLRRRWGKYGTTVWFDGKGKSPGENHSLELYQEHIPACVAG